jgi:hypothetical protein
VRDGVSVIACNFPVRVPAVTLQSDARTWSLAATVRDVMTAPVTDGHSTGGRVIGPNRKPIAPLDRGPAGPESTDPSARSAVI